MSYNVKVDFYPKKKFKWKDIPLGEMGSVYF